MDSKKNPYTKQHNDEGRKKGLIRSISQFTMVNLKSTIVNLKFTIVNL